MKNKVNEISSFGICLFPIIAILSIVLGIVAYVFPYEKNISNQETVQIDVNCNRPEENKFEKNCVLRIKTTDSHYKFKMLSVSCVAFVTITSLILFYLSEKNYNAHICSWNKGFEISSAYKNKLNPTKAEIDLFKAYVNAITDL